jgi:hypothetical protein
MFNSGRAQRLLPFVALVGLCVLVSLGAAPAVAGEGDGPQLRQQEQLRWRAEHQNRHQTRNRFEDGPDSIEPTVTPAVGPAQIRDRDRDRLRDGDCDQLCLRERIRNRLEPFLGRVGLAWARLLG